MHTRNTKQQKQSARDSTVLLQVTGVDASKNASEKGATQRPPPHHHHLGFMILAKS
ncbi:hypothetical protein HanIR_Chr02g0067431 [Helianthus annuus]|nr:hypothetical protein HanIR_Chr02g0067431 [Helianthus annuus]